jgi:3-deoxy-D-manno-octulosonate 8-phosphate phosphatase (KDO 8-P phosphatase)
MTAFDSQFPASPGEIQASGLERPIVSPERWAAIRLLGCDVDGVLTDGGLTFDEEGRLLQTFNVRDGFGLVVARRVGIKIAWISGRPSKVAQKRFEELRLDHCILACADKAAAFRQLQEDYGFQREECCFIGDDFPDLPAFAVAGLKVAVADAEPPVIARADYVTRARGGRGAVREIIDLMLAARGHLDELIAQFDSATQNTPHNYQR